MFLIELIYALIPVMVLMIIALHIILLYGLGSA